VPDVPSTLRVLAKHAVVIGDGRHPPARLGADGCEFGMKRLPILLTITTGRRQLLCSGSTRPWKPQTNWLQRWLKQKVQREEGVINSPGSRPVRRCIIRQGGPYDVVAALPFFWRLVLIFFWVIFLMLTMNIARSKVTAAPMGCAGLHPPAGYRHHPAIAPVSFTGVACDLTRRHAGLAAGAIPPAAGVVVAVDRIGARDSLRIQGLPGLAQPMNRERH